MTTFLVNRVSINPQLQTVEWQGQQLQAVINVLEVELVDQTGQQSTITRRFYTPEDQAAAVAKYAPGQNIDIDLS